MLNINNNTYLILCCVMIVSCASGTSFIQTGKKYPPYQGNVEVYHGLPAGVHFEEIGLVSTEANSIHFKASVFKALREKAAGKGANAIIMTSFERKDKSIDLAGNQRSMDENIRSGNNKSDQFRPNPDYAPTSVVITARAIRIEPIQ